MGSILGGGPGGGGTFGQNLMGINPYTPEAIGEQNFAPAIQQSQAGMGNDFAQQQAFANALLAQSQGAGPNPALEQLKAATQQNAQQGAGLIASQKGINPALAARMAAQNTANANQQAAGQAANMRAQQQLGAQSNLGNVYGQLSGEQLQNQQILQNAQAQQNNAINTRSNIASGLSAANTKASQQGAQGVLTTGGSLLSGMAGFMAGGGEVGGDDDDSSGLLQTATKLAPLAMALISKGGHVPGKAKVEGDSYSNDTVPTMLSPGEIVVPRTKAKDPDKAKAFIDQLMAKKGKSSSSSDSGPQGYSKVLDAHRKLEQKVKELEALVGKKHGKV